MPSFRVLPSTALALTVAACSDGTTPPGGDPADAAVRVINATATPIDVVVDGQTVLRGLGTAAVSDRLPVASGTRRLQLRDATGRSAAVSVDATPGRAVTAFAAAASPTAALSAAVLADSNATVPTGKSKLRVTHLAPGSETRWEIFRTQPDFQQPIRIMTPFRYGETSPYLQSDPGTWEVWVAPFGSTGTTRLATSGAIAVPSGEKRTVVLVDSAGVLKFRVLPE
jgi:hypothetical protein